MTDFPSPSDRPKTAHSAAFRLFRPIFFAVGAIGATVGAVIVIHHQAETQIAAVTAPAALALSSIALPDPEPAPPITTADFKGFDLKSADQQADAEPPASDRYELTLRLERGDTVEKVLADINVPEADRRQIDTALKALLKKRRLAVGESIDLQLQTMPDQPDAPRVLTLSIRPQPQREYIVTRRDDGSYEALEKIYQVRPRIVRVDAVRRGSLQQSGMKAGAPTAATLEFIRALSYDVDFQRELKEGQHFTLLLEQQVTSDGHVADPGRLLAASCPSRQQVMRRHGTQDGPTGHPDGGCIIL